MAYIFLSYYSNDKCSSLLSKGLQRRQFSEVAQNIAMVSEKELAATSGISQRTISRMKPDQILPNPVSEVLISIMRTYGRAVEVFESEEIAHRWLKTPLAALGNKTPLEATSNRFSAELALDILGRIEHGIYS